MEIRRAQCCIRVFKRRYYDTVVRYTPFSKFRMTYLNKLTTKFEHIFCPMNAHKMATIMTAACLLALMEPPTSSLIVRLLLNFMYETFIELSIKIKYILCQINEN